MTSLIEKFRMIAFVFVVVSFTMIHANAQYFNGPVTTAAGEAGRASLDPLESAFLNPASLSHFKNYYAGVYWSDSSGVTSGQQRDVTAVISDSTPDKILPAAFAFTKRRITGNGAPIEQKNYHLAVADRILSRLSVGVSGHRLESEINGVKHNQHNFTLGLLFAASENFGVALVGYDLLDAGSDIPAEVQLKSSLAIGMTYVLQNFVQFKFDVSQQIRNNPKHRSRIMMGVDSALHEFFALRLGAQWDGLARQNFLSAGVGFTGPRLSIDYAFQKETSPADGGSRHLVDLRLKF